MIPEAEPSMMKESKVVSRAALWRFQAPGTFGLQIDVHRPRSDFSKSMSWKKSAGVQNHMAQTYPQHHGIVNDPSNCWHAFVAMLHHISHIVHVAHITLDDFQMPSQFGYLLNNGLAFAFFVQLRDGMMICLAPWKANHFARPRPRPPILSL